MQAGWKTAARAVGGVVLAAALLWLVVRGVDRQAVVDALRTASIPGLLLAAAVMFSHNFFRILRWRELLSPVRQGISPWPLFVATIFGLGLSTVLPGRLGELVRPALLAAREGLPLGPCIGSVVADRVLDLIGILVLFGGALLVLPIAGSSAEFAVAVRATALIVLPATVGACIALVLVARSRERLTRRLGDRRGAVARLLRVALDLSRGGEALTRPASAARVFVYSLLAWGLIGLGTWLGVRACGARVPLPGLFVIQPALVFGVALPTPGGVGGYHYAMKVGLEQLFGVPAARAAATGLLVHLAAFLPTVLVGASFLVFRAVPFAALARVVADARHIGAHGLGEGRP